MKKILVAVAILFGSSLQAQEVKNDTIEVVDSLSLNVVEEIDSLQVKIAEKSVVQMDSLWLDAMYNSPLNLSIDKENKSLDSLVSLELPTDTLKARLQILDAETPFDLEYNPVLERLIANYLKTRSKYYPKMMSRAKYYFPMIEETLSKYDLPLEIKYLAVVESALNPRAKSWVGATGMWQFMYQTGKQYKLKVSSYVDERQDPIRSLEAACKYLTFLHNMFDDWDLALAAYNSGPGNVTKAIRRSGGYKNYWNIRPYLPRETAGYLPAFYAIMYIFENADKHHIKPLYPEFQFFETDTVKVKQTLTFTQISKFVDLPVSALQFLNPAYKLDIIPYVKGKNYSLRLPIDKVGIFVEKEAVIYALATKEAAEREKPLPKYFEMNQRIRYKVKSGDYLGKIANKYGVKVSEIKKWNGLKSSNISIGQRLTIYPRRL